VEHFNATTRARSFQCCSPRILSARQLSRAASARKCKVPRNTMQTEATRETRDAEIFYFLRCRAPLAYLRFVISHLPSLPPAPWREKCPRSRGYLSQRVRFFPLSLSLSLSLSFSLSDSGVRRAGTLISFAPRFRHVDQKFSVIQETNSRRFAPPRATFGDKVFSRKVITGNENMRAMPGIWVAGIIITECN